MRFILLIPSIAVSVIAACGSGAVEAHRRVVTGFRLDFGLGQKTAVMRIEDTIKIETHVIDSAGTTLDVPTPVVFVSRNTDVVRVDASGQVTLIAKGGAFVVGTLTTDGRVFSDSVNVVWSQGVLLGR
jgi:hypothetical protein